jgi:hypothetical protein
MGWPHPSALTYKGGDTVTRILHLTLHRKWFDAIATGEKLEEYRATNDYWGKRLLKQGSTRATWNPICFDEIHFRNGYSLGMPWMRVEWKGLKAGQFEEAAVFAIQLGKILEIKNWTKKAGTP